ncbi:MAG: NAD-dependent epimerase/dehydratase family protein [Bacteroidales bacterium]
MKRVGITGQSGFVGTHLYQTLRLDPEAYEVMEFRDEYFDDAGVLADWVASCDAIVHLAAVNRHADPGVIYQTNVDLVTKLIRALEETGSTPHVLFSSSSQEDLDNPYGQSKLEGRRLLSAWAGKHGARFSGLVIPNVFGPFGHPYYNSVVATFCHQLNHGETPKIMEDREIHLIYVGELVDRMIDLIGRTGDPGGDRLDIPHTQSIRVSDILNLLNGYREEYGKRGVFPALKSVFERNLFNTFRCYMDLEAHFPVLLDLKTDNRGSFVETMRLRLGGQVSFSSTHPGITRGNHFHTRKIERFAVIRGKARIQLRRVGTDRVFDFELDGSKPSYVDMPIWYTHNITNLGDEELLTLFWINEFFDPNDPDTYFEEV